MSHHINVKDLNDFRVKFGKQRAEALLKALGTSHAIVRAFDTEIGKEILSDVLSVMNNNLKKIVANEASDDEKAEFRMAKAIATRWAGRIETYYKSLSQLRGE